MPAEPRSSTAMSSPKRLQAAAGLVGPAAFTGAWLACGLRQQGVRGYGYRSEHISGLAAPDALNPSVMAGGFVVLGTSLWPFSVALRGSLGPSAGAAPHLLRLAGAALVTAAVFRRDRMLLGPPPEEPEWVQSWRNDVHDGASAIAYACALVAPLALARAAGRDARWRRLRRPAIALSLSMAAVHGLFVSRLMDAYGGVLQRLSVSLALTGVMGMAVIVLRDG